MSNYSVALVALAVALSTYVHWANDFSSFLWAAMVVIVLAYKSAIPPLIIVMLLFTASLILVTTLASASRLFVYAVLLPSLLAAYTGKWRHAFWLGLLAYHLWMSGRWGIVYAVSQFLIFTGLKAMFSPPEGQVRAWSSILGPFNFNLSPMTSYLDAYQTHLQPTVLLLSQYVFKFMDKVVYILVQAVKCVVWELTERPAWCPDWQIEEYRKIEARVHAQRLKDKVPPEIARKQRELARQRYHSHEPYARPSRLGRVCHPSPIANRPLSSMLLLPPPKPAGLEFLRAINSSEIVEPPRNDSPDPIPVPPNSPDPIPVPAHSPDPVPVLSSPPAPTIVPALPPPTLRISRPASQNVRSILRQPKPRGVSGRVTKRQPSLPKAPKKRVTFAEQPRYRYIEPELMEVQEEEAQEEEVQEPEVQEPGVQEPEVQEPEVQEEEVQEEEPTSDQNDQAMEDMMDGPMEELNSLFKSLEVQSQADDESMNIDGQPPALAWIYGERPFVPLYSHVPIIPSMAHLVDSVSPSATLSGLSVPQLALPAILEVPRGPEPVQPSHYTALAASQITLPPFSALPIWAPPALTAAPVVSTTEPPAVTAVQTVPESNDVAISAPVLQTPFTAPPPQSAAAVPTAIQTTAFGVPTSFVFDFSAPSFPAAPPPPPAATPTSQATSAPRIFQLTDHVAPVPPPETEDQEALWDQEALDEALEAQLIAEYNATEPREQPTFQSPQPAGTQSQGDNMSVSGPSLAAEVQLAPCPPMGLGGLSQEEEDGLFRLFGEIQAAERQATSSSSRPAGGSSFNVPNVPTLAASGFHIPNMPPLPLPTLPALSSSETRTPGVPPTEDQVPSSPLSELTELDDDVLNQLHPLGSGSNEENQGRFSPETIQQLDSILSVERRPDPGLDMGYGHVPNLSQVYADDPADVARATQKPDPNPRAHKRRG
ncbi:hypothetical protein F5Y07DRAFT_394704 [Xylaria sp. FL0933]|nr:hypothetical protein F5Y07DRAFT_394704 [Xylaria sp. FL0933]